MSLLAVAFLAWFPVVPLALERGGVRSGDLRVPPA